MQEASEETPIEGATFYRFAAWLADERSALASLGSMYGGNLNARHFYLLEKIAEGVIAPDPGSLTVRHLVTMGLLASERGEAMLTLLGKSALADYKRRVL